MTDGSRLKQIKIRDELEKLKGTAPGFWERVAQERAAALEDQNSGAAQHQRLVEKANLPHAHGRIGANRLMGTCPPCGERLIRQMAEMPAYTHIGRNGQRLAEIWGVTYVPYEERSETGQERVDRRELARRKEQQ